MKTDKKSKAKEDFGEGDISEETEEVLKADKEKKQIAVNQPVNKEKKNLAKKMNKQKVKVDKNILDPTCLTTSTSAAITISMRLRQNYAVE
jgi:hypothetical protein